MVWDTIAAEIERRNVLLVVCTRAITLSRPARREYNLAITLEKMVVPLQYDTVEVPLAIRPDIDVSFDETNFHEIFRIVAERLPGSYDDYAKEQAANEKALADLQDVNEDTQPAPRMGRDYSQ